MGMITGAEFNPFDSTKPQEASRASSITNLESPKSSEQVDQNFRHSDASSRDSDSVFSRSSIRSSQMFPDLEPEEQTFAQKLQSSPFSTIGGYAFKLLTGQNTPIYDAGKKLYSTFQSQVIKAIGTEHITNKKRRSLAWGLGAASCITGGLLNMSISLAGFGVGILLGIHLAPAIGIASLAISIAVLAAFIEGTVRGSQLAELLGLKGQAQTMAGVGIGGIGALVAGAAFNSTLGALAALGAGTVGAVAIQAGFGTVGFKLAGYPAGLIGGGFGAIGGALLYVGREKQEDTSNVTTRKLEKFSTHPLTVIGESLMSAYKQITQSAPPSNKTASRDEGHEVIA